MLHPKTKESLKNKSVLIFLTLALFGIVYGYFVYFFVPEYVHLFVQEDHLVEVLSAISYLIASTLGVWVYKKYKRWRMFTMVVIVLGPLGFFSELSFGEDHFDLDMPVVNDVKIDAAHDLVMLSYVTLEAWIGFYGILSLTLLTGAAIVAVIYFNQAFFKNFTGNIHHFVPGIYLCLFVLFLGSAILMDLKEHYVPYAIVEELLELYAGVSLCDYSVSLHKLEKRRQRLSVRGAYSSPGSPMGEAQTMEALSVDEDVPPVSY